MAARKRCRSREKTACLDRFTEIFVHDRHRRHFDVPTQRIADIYLLSRDGDLHGE